MSNSQKGEFTAALGGTTYTFKMGTRALVEMQELLSPPGQVLQVEDIIRDVLRKRLKYVQAFMWAGLRKYHPDVTMAALEDLLDNADPAEIDQLLQRLGLTTVPDPADVKELEGPRPPKAQARKPRGTGANSKSRPAVPA